MRHLFVYFFLLPFLPGLSPKGTSYIKFDYMGIVDKPIPEVVFFTDSSFEKSAFVETFRLGETEFDSLKYLIRTDSKLFLKAKNDFYKVTIFTGPNKEYFFIKSKQDLANAFVHVMDKLKRSKQQEEIKDELKYVLKRI
jgi:hypothetical protein